MHSSAAESLVGYILSRLRQDGLLEDRVAPDFLVRNWPPACEEEWTTKSVREMFFASPRFPRLLNPEVLRDTIAEGVREGKFGYVGKAYGAYLDLPRIGAPAFGPEEVEFSDQVVLLPQERARALPGRVRVPEEGGSRPAEVSEGGVGPVVPMVQAPPAGPPVSMEPARLALLRWSGEVPPQKWTQFYMRILSRFATDPTLRLRVDFTVSPEIGIPEVTRSEIEAVLRELGLSLEGLEGETGT